MPALSGLCALIGREDAALAAHCAQVGALAEGFANYLGLPAFQVRELKRAGLLHDVGKLYVPERIRNAPRKLTPGEWKIMRRHSDYSTWILRGWPALSGLIPAVRGHHEDWCGAGYPQGLKETAIPVPARILHLCDVFDALVSDRPYREGWSRERVLTYIERYGGVMFDPLLTERFLRWQEHR